MVSYLNGNLAHVCMYGLHVIGSVNQLQQLNEVTVRGSVTAQWSNVQTSSSAIN